MSQHQTQYFRLSEPSLDSLNFFNVVYILGESRGPNYIQLLDDRSFWRWSSQPITWLVLVNKIKQQPNYYTT